MGVHFGQLSSVLRAQGCFVVDNGPPLVQSSTIRAQQLALTIDQVLRDTKQSKVVLLGHSQGGLDVVTLLENQPVYADRIAAIATLSTPYRGTPLGDWAEFAPPLVFPVTSALAAVVEAAQTRPQGTDAHAYALDPVAAYRTLRDRPHSRFHPNVPLFSIAGVTGMDIEQACDGGAWSAPTLIDYPSVAQMSGAVLLRMASVGSHDGVVPVRSAKAEGRFLGCVAADHTDWMTNGTEPNLAMFVPTAFAARLVMGLEDVGRRQDPGAMDDAIPQLAGMARARTVNAPALAAVTSTEATPAPL
jgi:pimeloyl-ACP methyl ester carboxylesterase